jgi:steroid delta-isomerase-like uncharacterized protein
MSTLTSPSIGADPAIVRAFIEEYFEAWKGTDVNRIMSYYAEDIVLQLPTGVAEGQQAVRERFVSPFVAAFPGNVHSIVNLAHASNLVAVEWTFRAVHRGDFAGHPASGRQVEVPGGSFYEYNLESRLITAGRIYFDRGTLLSQIAPTL